MNLLLSVGLVVGLASKAWLKSSWCNPGWSRCCRSSTLGGADGPVVPDGDDPATPMISYDAYDPAGAPVIQD